MKSSFASRHGPSLGPGQYNPQYTRGIELKDIARQSSMFKSSTRRMVAPAPSHNLSPGQYLLTSSVGVRDKKRQLASFASKKKRFAGAYGMHENRESDGFSVVDIDNARWTKGTAYVSTTARQGPEKMRASEAPDVMYDWYQRTELKQRMLDSEKKMSFTAQSKAKRFPEMITANPEHEPARMGGVGPGSYFKPPPKTASSVQPTSSFKSGTRRFRTKKQPIVDFWGFNISQSHGSGVCRGGAFSTLKRWDARPGTR